jgi:hypothetical protein
MAARSPSCYAREVRNESRLYETRFLILQRFYCDIFSFFVGSMFEILRGHLYKPLRGRVELLGEHCGQSQQSRMELGLRGSRGLSRASCDQRAQVEWEMVLARPTPSRCLTCLAGGFASSIRTVERSIRIWSGPARG